MEKKLILFDYDGTIADTHESIISGIKYSLKKHHIIAPDENIIKSYIGRSLIPVFKEITQSNNDTLIENLLFAYREWYFKNQDSGDLKDTMFPDVKNTLRILFERGCCLGVATNKSRKGLVDGLKKHDLIKFFSTIKTVNECKPKPDPEMGNMALKELQILKENAVMIGDTINDAIMAKNCGIKFIGVNWGYNDPKVLKENDALFVIKAFKELPEIINTIFN